MTSSSLAIRSSFGDERPACDGLGNRDDRPGFGGRELQPPDRLDRCRGEPLGGQREDGLAADLVPFTEGLGEAAASCRGPRRDSPAGH